MMENSNPQIPINFSQVVKDDTVCGEMKFEWYNSSHTSGHEHCVGWPTVIAINRFSVEFFAWIVHGGVQPVQFRVLAI